MAVAIDVAGSETLSTSSASPHSYTGLTTGGSLSNGAVTFVVCYDTHVTGSSATWDSVACTLAASGNDGTTNGRVEIWALSPIGTHTGNKTFSVSWTGGGNAQTAIIGASWTGVDQTGGTISFPHGNSNAGSGGTPQTSTVTITSATGNAIIAGHATTGSIGSVSDTQLFLDNTPTNISAAANRAAGSASHAMTSSITGASTLFWVAAGCDILAASVVPHQPYFQQFTAQKRKGFIGWDLLLDHRRCRKLILPKKFFSISSSA